MKCKRRDQRISARSTLPRHHPAIRRIGLAPAGRRLHFPQPSVPWHRSVRCSHAVPLPKEFEGNKKGRWKKVAAGTAVAVACVLGAVYLSPAVSAPPAKPTEPGFICVEIESCENNVLDRTRDEVREILFKKGTCGVPKMESWMDDPMMFDATLKVVQWHIAKKDYHAAEEICKQTIKIGPESDARPRLLMAVIRMMLAVEVMLEPETGEQEPEAYVKSAMESWKEFYGSVGRKVPTSD
ncbi:uncharacterized protein LOC122040820 [Zingiber officinale]|uniref:uncharacterized protein LOC122040820 n=1 Tax=Zingiber officinale TaxID=94328 RepID=UPI001C4B89E6|nr:uncharacterized protein LOC122040820 [Zingiber officinale]